MQECRRQARWMHGQWREHVQGAARGSDACACTQQQRRSLPHRGPPLHTLATSSAARLSLAMSATPIGLAGVPPLPLPLPLAPPPLPPLPLLALAAAWASS